MSLFGLSARRTALDYLLITALFAFLLLAIAWSIDLARHFQHLRRAAEFRQVPLSEILLPYLFYRAVDILVRLLPVACFFGVFCAEVLRRMRLETVILMGAGLSPFKMLAPILVYGVVVGAVLWQLEERLRPYVIIQQIELGEGAYGKRFSPRWFPFDSWFLYGDVAVRGKVFRGEPPAMRDVLIFRGLQDEQLGTIHAAERLDPTDVPGQWRLSGVKLWNPREGQNTSVDLPDQLIELPLIREELRYHEIQGFYLANAPLAALSQAHPGSAARISADMATWRRGLIFVTPFVLAGLAISLARFGFSGRLLRPIRMIAAAGAGYIGVVSIKVIYSMGETGGISPATATLLPLVLLMGVTAVLTYRAS
ncbi:LptF/LptG family permease [Candidatus Rhodobacter oscarellae]|uniref:LptF/LptG family permease n=1 Tax=Candidatus Rhodobacter oscarellae TaxID=1675527 RepID=UPI001F374348|nr:LptF/LptG family permease [Candidatus Rhodobacter lobularis]